MKTAAIVEIHTDDLERLLRSLGTDTSSPPIDAMSLSEYTYTHGTFSFERTLGIPTLPTPGRYDAVYLSLPISLLDFRMLTLPASPRETLEKLVPFELEPLIMDRAGEIVFDLIVTGTSDAGASVLVAFTRKEVLRRILAALGARGIDPEVVTCLDLLASAGGDLPSVVSSLIRGSLPEEAVRRATAARELSSPSLNLRKDDLAYKKKIEGLGKRLKVTAVLSAVFAIVLNLSLALNSFLLCRDEAATSAQTRALYAGLFPQDRKITDEIYQTKAHLKDLQTKGDLLVSADPLSFLLVLSSKRPGTVTYHEITINRNSVTLKGEASAAGDTEAVKAGLSDVLSSITIADVKSLSDGKVSFTLSGVRRQ